jgi:hypothetical protein
MKPLESIRLREMVDGPLLWSKTVSLQCVVRIRSALASQVLDLLSTAAEGKLHA